MQDLGPEDVGYFKNKCCTWSRCYTDTLCCWKAVLCCFCLSLYKKPVFVHLHVCVCAYACVYILVWYIRISIGLWRVLGNYLLVCRSALFSPATAARINRIVTTVIKPDCDVSMSKLPPNPSWLSNSLRSYSPLSHPHKAVNLFTPKM